MPKTSYGTEAAHHIANFIEGCSVAAMNTLLLWYLAVHQSCKSPTVTRVDEKDHHTPPSRQV